MKVKDLLHELAHRQPDEEIVVTWYDLEYVKNSVPESLLQDKEIVEQAWKEILDEADELLTAHLDFTQTGYEIIELFEEKITELLQKEEN